MPDERLEPASVTGRRDHGVRLDPFATGDASAPGVEQLDPGHDLEAPFADCVDHLFIDDGGGDAEPPQPPEHALLRDRQAVFGQVPDSLPAAEARHGIGETDRKPKQRRRDHVPRQAARALAQKDVRRRASRQPDLGRAALGEVVRDLHSRRAGAGDQHLPPPERFRVPVAGRVQQRGPGSGHGRASRGCGARCRSPSRRPAAAP